MSELSPLVLFTAFVATIAITVASVSLTMTSLQRLWFHRKFRKLNEHQAALEAARKNVMEAANSEKKAIVDLMTDVNNRIDSISAEVFAQRMGGKK